MIGQTISHYRIIEKLGEGGMGVVYLAEDTHLARRVAIKFLSSLDAPYRARFLREARAVSALSHPNIAAVYDYGETEDGQPYIVMELIRGATLGRLLEEESLTLARSVQIVASIAEALAEAHHQGIVHRDVKPSNVVITERGQVKVLDFGLVKQLTEWSGKETNSSAPTLFSTHTRSDVIVGTPLYLSPEQAKGKAVDGRSDLFALGALLYECITGRSAFSGESVIEIGAQVIHVDPPPPSRTNPAVPPELDRITMKALEKKVESRYQKAEDLLRDLRAVLATLSTDGYHPPTPLPRLTSSSRTLRTSALTTLTETIRRPRVSIGMLAVVILVSAVGVWAVVRFWKPAPYKPSPAALEWYNNGKEALRNGAFFQGMLALKQAVAADDKFALAHATLAEAWIELENFDEAKNEMLLVTELVPDRSRLPRIDGLYMDAIRATLNRNHAGAISAFREIAQSSPDDPFVHFDLGRAYERNENLKEAIDSYTSATHRSPQLASAFLRIGVLYGRQSEQSGAFANFQQAETLYQALGSVEGEAEVFFERGFLLNKLDRVAEAKHQFQRALELARTRRNQYQQVKTLLKLGDVASDERNYAEAEKYLHEAISVARANQIDNLTSRGLVDLGNMYVLKGDYPNAKKHFQESLEFAQKRKDSRNVARALLSLGSQAERESNPEESLRLIEQALPFYSEGGYRLETLQAFALLARAKAHTGDYDGAQKGFEQRLSIARELGNRSQEALGLGDLGLLFMNQGKYPEALSHFENGYSLFNSLGLSKNAALSLINRANALWRMGRYPDARAMLDQASAIVERPETGKDLASWFHLARARMALSERQLPDAKTNSQKALTLVGGQLKGTAVEAMFTLGLAQTLSGATHEGQSNCEKAVALATDTGDVARLAEALLALSEATLSSDAAGALSTSLHAQKLFARLSNQNSEWLSWLNAARASRSTRDEIKAREYAARANDLLSGLHQRLGAENYNAYLSRPDIQFFRKELSEFLR